MSVRLRMASLCFILLGCVALVGPASAQLTTSPTASETHGTCPSTGNNETNATCAPTNTTNATMTFDTGPAEERGNGDAPGFLLPAVVAAVCVVALIASRRRD